MSDTSNQYADPVLQTLDGLTRLIQLTQYQIRTIDNEAIIKLQNQRLYELRDWRNAIENEMSATSYQWDQYRIAQKNRTD